jgi:anti-anti-sigma factor
MTAMVDVTEHRANLTLSGKLTYDENESFRESLEILTRKEPREVNIDMRDLKFVDSAGLGMLLLLRDRMPQGCRIGLSNSNPQVHKILLLTKLDQLFTIL